MPCSVALPVLASGHDDGHVRVWNLERSSTLNMKRHTNTVSCLGVCQIDIGGGHLAERLISCSFDGTVAIWEVRKVFLYHPETWLRLPRLGKWEGQSSPRERGGGDERLQVVIQHPCATSRCPQRSEARAGFGSSSRFSDVCPYATVTCNRSA